MKNLKSKSILFIILISSFSSIAQTFNITGNTTDVENGTWLYLKTASPQVMLDSTKVEDGKFKLVGKTNEKVSQMLVHTKNFSNYTFFWAEKKYTFSIKRRSVQTSSNYRIENSNRGRSTL